MKSYSNFWQNEDGQGMVEYGLIIVLIALAVVGALMFLAPKIAELYNIELSS